MKSLYKYPTTIILVLVVILLSRSLAVAYQAADQAERYLWEDRTLAVQTPEVEARLEEGKLAVEED